MDMFRMGKSLIGGGGGDGGSGSGSGGSGGGFNPLAMFKQLDKNGDGKITEEDFVLVVRQMGLGSIGESVIRKVFHQIDTNHNGQLEMSEALHALELIKKLIPQQ